MTSSLTRPVLARKPQADFRSLISGLLDNMRRRVDLMPVVPGGNVIVKGQDIVELSAELSELTVAVRNHLKWSA